MRLLAQLFRLLDRILDCDACQQSGLSYLCSTHQAELSHWLRNYEREVER